MTEHIIRGLHCYEAPCALFQVNLKGQYSTVQIQGNACRLCRLKQMGQRARKQVSRATVSI